MCSFLFFLTNRPEAHTPETLQKANRYMAARGPDGTTAYQLNEFVTMLHNLLHISGETPVKQPIIDMDNEVVVLFNGEIYNYMEFSKEYNSDSECIIPLYNEFGFEFVKKLDGEFAIVVFDLRHGHLLVTTDTFMTKPLCISRSPAEIGIATYKSALQTAGFKNIEWAQPNCTTVYNVYNGFEMIHSSEVFKFDLRQYKTCTDDWEKAFEQAVCKRAIHGVGKNKCFVLLSAGYDSGAIALALNRAGIKYDTFSSFKNEDVKVLEERQHINRLASCENVMQVSEISRDQQAAQQNWLAVNAEPFVYEHDDAEKLRLSLFEDGGARAMNYICNDMSELGYRIVLSGSGADEIISDYGFDGKKIYYHSEFGGKFPKDLSEIFPWKKFYGDTQRSYLFKDEFVAGAHGIEGRYPFLDPRVVQEFLWLHHDLKNMDYKGCIYAYLTKHQYPVKAGVKTGFAV